MPKKKSKGVGTASSRDAMGSGASTNSSQGAFGWEFQKAAALLLMLERIKECKRLNVEGPTEDIELDMGEGRYIFAQAKSMERDCPSSVNDKNFYNRANEHLENAIRTLAAACEKAKNNGDIKAVALVYVSNISYPFARHDVTMHRFKGGDRFQYDELSDNEKKRVSDKLKLLEKAEYMPEFEKKFSAQCMSFPNVQRSVSRYREIYDMLQDILSAIGMPQHTSKNLLEKVRAAIDDVTIKDNFALSKEDFISMILEIQLSLMGQQLNEIFNKKFTTGQCQRIIQLYSDTIASFCFSYPLLSKINSEYIELYPDGYEADKMLEFSLNNPFLVDNYVSIPSTICDEKEILLVKAALIYKILDERMIFYSVNKKFYE